MIEKIKGLKILTDCSMPTDIDDHIEREKTVAYNKAIDDVVKLYYAHSCEKLPTKYSIAFAGFVATNIEVKGNEIKIIDSINGFGDKIPNKSVSVLKK